MATVPDGGTLWVSGFSPQRSGKDQKKGAEAILLLTAESVPDIFEE